MAFKPEEGLSADALQIHLIASGYATSASWTPGPDPPDLSFTVLRPKGVTESWGVEVTALTQYVEQSFKKGGKVVTKPVERRTFEPAVHAICERINQKYGSQLSMSYCLTVTGPLDPKVFRELEQRIVDYIQSGNTQEIALDHSEAIALLQESIGGSDLNDPIVQYAVQHAVQLTAPQYERVRLKTGPYGKGVWVGSGLNEADRLPENGGFVADVSATVEYAVRRILDQKLRILKTRVSGYDRKFLLIWNDLPLARSSDLIEALASRTLTDVDSVFFIDVGWKAVTLVADPAGLFDARTLPRDAEIADSRL